MNGKALWELQQLDTALNQLQRRLTRLPEASALDEADRRLADHRAAAAAAAKQLSDAETIIETIEHESDALTTKRKRLEQQLKIVTEVRQADALNHEIEVLNAHRDELDDRELTRISAALAAGDAATAERLAHSLRGVAGNLGIKSVLPAAQAAEKLLRERVSGEALTAALREMSTVLDPLLAQLNQQLPAVPDTAPAAGAIDPATMRAAASALAKLLADFDSGAVDFVEANLPALRPLFGEANWGLFQGHIKSYAFADALAALRTAVPDITS